MKIAFDAKRAFNNFTGLGNYSRSLINALMERFPDEEYRLFTPVINNRLSNFFKPSSNALICTPATFIHRLFPSYWRTRGMVDDLVAEGVDLFHGLSNELPVGIERSGIKTVVTIHDLIFLRYPSYYSFSDRKIYYNKFSSACQKASLIIATSEQTKKDISRFFKIPASKIRVIYQPCDSIFHRRVTEQEKEEVRAACKLPEKFILSVGTIEQRKNQLVLVKAFREAGIPGMKLVLAGNQTAYATGIKKYVHQHGLTNDVIFLPRFDFNQLPAIYRLSSLFVYPSEFEGFGIPVLEAMASGIPVIAANTSSLPEVGGKAAAYFDPHDASLLAAWLKKISADTVLRDDMIRQGYMQAARFDAMQMADQVMAAYRAL
jgi:glycosyltransferase involved in cell wall biosynthesis